MAGPRADILAIVSKAIFEDQALSRGDLIGPGEVWSIDRYNSKHKTFNALREGGRIFLVTVRPPNEQLWFVGVIDQPVYDGVGSWIGRPNDRPVTDITPLRRTIMFTSNKTMSQDPGALGMSLQTPRAITTASAAEILAVVGGARPQLPPQQQAVPPPPPRPAIIEEEKKPVQPARITPEQLAEKSARNVVLEREAAQLVVLYDKMQETYGLRLPESLAYAAGFFAGLHPPEREEIERTIGTPIGVASWFGGPREQREVQDERLRDRLPFDPPEFVPILARPAVELNGESVVKERWGLWYDDPDELPTGIAKCTLRTSGGPRCDVTLFPHSSLLAVIRGAFDSDKPDITTAAASPTATTTTTTTTTSGHRAAIMDWLEDAMRTEMAKVREVSAIPNPFAGSGRAREFDWALGYGPATPRLVPYIPNWDMPMELVTEGAASRRIDAYRRGDSVVDEWIEQARSDLRDGSPGRALAIGRELHLMQATKWLRECTELLLRAYSALGRRPLADIVRVVYRHHWPDVAIFELPPPHPLSAAAASGDIEDITNAITEGDTPPSPDDIEEALAVAKTIKALDALLDNASSYSPPISTDTALWRRLQLVFRSRREKVAAHHRTLALRLMERGTVNGRAFERVLRGSDELLITTAARRVDLESTMGGSPPLHQAAKLGSASALKLLLERGADPRSKDAKGHMPHDVVREAQAERPNDPNVTDIFVLLQKAGGVPKPPLPADEEIEYCEGDEVHHPKLGDGVVEAVTGEGEEARLRIRFASETRHFLAKFVTPKA